ncbi:MAG: LUD domain-containing protein [Aggregatilineales bacterium]
MTSSTRDAMLSKLRAARRPFEDAPPRPESYLPVTPLVDERPEALLERFAQELDALKGQLFVAASDAEARDLTLELLHNHHAERILAWDFAHIPAAGLQEAILAAGIEILQPALHDELRPETLARAETAQVGLTGADAAAATTGTLIVTSGPGKGRLPTILAPVHLVIITVDQIVPRIESWVARQREDGLLAVRGSANFCFITGPSRTGDIEMELILGVHGPGQLQVIVKR